MKENDWLVAGLNSPDFSTDDFILAGLNVDNTQFLTPDQYKKSQYIKDKFTENGVFNESAFNNFYQQKATQFGQLQTSEITDTFSYDPFDTRSVGKKNIKSSKFKVEQVANTNRNTTMFSGSIFENNYSQRELAQQNKIFNTTTQEWEEESPNDRSFVNSPFKWITSLFDDPLVYAQYDQDGEHYDQFTGQIVKHHKGEYKINKYGLPYTETLGGRSLIGKEVVSKLDTITVDKEGIDKYNFFDSDDLDKSTAGTIAKSAAAITPLLLGGPTAAIYSGIMVGREILKTLPMLYGIMSSWSNTDPENETLNKLAGLAQGITGSTSDSGRASMLNTEQIGSLMTDVALQWGQQKFIAQGINKLRGSNKLMEEATNKAALTYATQKHLLEEQAKRGIITEQALTRYIGNPEKWSESAIGSAAIKHFTSKVEPIISRSRRLGADSSLAYMALVSNTDVYQSMLEAGASRKEAAAVTLGSTLGMFGVDKYLHLGEIFFDDLTAESERQIRRTVSKEAKSWYDNVIKNVGAQEPKKESNLALKKYIQAGLNIGRKATSEFSENLKYHSLGFFGKALGEGLEEVSEEIVTDASKALYELAGQLGYDTTVKDVGAFDNWAARYGMSFLGGALGGSLFYGVDLYQNGKFNIDQTQDELIYLARNGKTKEALNMLEEFHDKGKLGSINLSIDTTTDEAGQKVFVTADSNHQSQNDFVYDRLKETINQLDNIINENRANLSDEQLFEKMILSDVRFNSLKDYLQDVSYSIRYQQNYQSALNQVVNLEGELQKASLTQNGRASELPATDTQSRNSNEEQQLKKAENLNKIKEDLAKAKEHLNNFINGTYSQEYVEKMLFALDPELNQDFIAMTYVQWLYNNHDGKTPDKLTEDEAIRYKQEYLDYKKSAQEQDLNNKFTIYKNIKQQVDPILQNISENQEAFSKFQEEFSKLKSEESPIFNVRNYTYDDVLDFIGETEESDSYKNRNLPENKDNRIRVIDEENYKQLQAYKDGILSIIEKAGGFIDPNSRRELSLLINNRNKDIVKAILENISTQITKDNTVINTDTGEIIKAGELTDLDSSILQILESINLDDTDKTLDWIKDIVRQKYIKKYQDYNTKLNSIYDYIVNTGYINPESPDFIQDQLQERIKQLLDKGNTFDDIIQLFTKNDSSQYGDITEADIASKFNEIISRYQEGTLEDFNLDTLPIDSSVEQDQDYQNDLRYYQDLYKDFLEQIKNNPIIQLNDELDKKVKDINPVVDFIKSLGLKLNTNIDNLEDILQKLDKRYQQEEDVSNFTLTTEEEESLQEAEYIFKLAKSYLYAASNKANILSPFGHNTTINDFAKNNKNVYPDFQELPVISEDVANMYRYELDRYLWQVGVLNPQTGEYNQGSWFSLSNQNKINKAKQHIKANKAWNLVLYNLFSGLSKSNSFKFEYNGEEYDLLKGFNQIPEVNKDTKDSEIYNNQVFDLFYKNIKELIDKGWTYKQIWERSGLFTKILDPKEIIEQKTASLDENITIDRLTQYDKMIILLTTAGLNSTQFYDYLQKRINEEDKIAPLTIQQWVSRVGVSYINNPQLFHDTINYLYQTFAPDKIPIFGIYVGGDAGSGKSSVVGKNIISWTDSSNIWLSAPKESQSENLFKSIGKGIKMLNRDDIDGSKSLFSRLGIDLQAYKEALEHIKSNKEDSPYYSIKINNEATIVKINPNKFNIHKIDNAPEVITIDEVTHLSSLELQILSNWAQLNNVGLIFLGDDKQKGFSKLGRNIDRESIFTIRTPNLGISLRDNNAQHQYNLNVLSKLIKQLLDLDANDINYKTQVATIKSLLSNIHFKIYQSDDINGDLLTQNLTEEQVNLMNGTIGYVGGNTSTLQLLQRLKGDKVTVLPETDIQGQEFDYVVIDKDWNIPDSQSSDVSFLNFLQDLYTMISRGRNGSIIIDSGLLANAIGNNKIENSKAIAQNVSSYTAPFRENMLNIIKQILVNNKPQEIPNTININQPSEEEPLKEDLKTVQIEQPEGNPPISEELASEEQDADLTGSEELSTEIPENPMLCYGNTTFTGMQVEKRDGKQVWINPRSAIKRDIQIFTDKEEISDDQEQVDLSNKIKKLKNTFLLNKGYDAKLLDGIITEQEYNNIQWFIEARPQNNQDNFIRNTGFVQINGIGPKNLVFSVIGKVKLQDGSEGIITLGLMSDPKDWINKNKDNKDHINKKIRKLQNKLITNLSLTIEQKERIKAKINSYKVKLDKLDLSKSDSDPMQYNSYINQITEQYVDTPILIQIPKIITPGLTDLHRLDKPIRLSRKSKEMIKNINERLTNLKILRNKQKGNNLFKIKLDREIQNLEKKLAEFQEIEDSSFRSINPYTIVSPMYIYAPSGQSLNVDDSIIGRYNVIFVTNDEDLNSEDLVDIYMRQKNAAALEESNNGVVDLKNTKVTPRVRMVVLNNLGVSFQDLSNPYLAESMTSENKVIKNGKEYIQKQIYPFKTNFMGVRMYVGLWNFRANLLQFEKKLVNFVETLPIDQEKLDLYLTVKDLLYRQNYYNSLSKEEQKKHTKLSTEEKRFLEANKNLDKFEEVSKLIDQFNDSLHNQVKQFRLGSSFTNGAYVRKLTGDLSMFYDTSEKTPNGIYINTSTLRKYIDISEGIFKHVLDEIVTCDYNKMALLSTKGNVKNSFANHITSLANSNGKILITDRSSYEDIEICFGSSYDTTGSKGILNTFSHIPAVLSKVFKYTSIRQRHLNSNNFDLENDYSIRITGTITDESGQEVEINKPIHYKNLWNCVNMIEAQDEYDIEAINGYVFDPTLSNFFSFAFHGTLESVDSSAQRASDALFPKGFFADPLSTTETANWEGNRMFIKAQQQQIFFGADVRVGDPTFFILMSDIKQSLENFKESQKEPENNIIKQQCLDLINQTIQNYPILKDIMNQYIEELDDISDDNKLEWIKDSISEELEKITTSNFNGVFNGTIKQIDPNMLFIRVNDTSALDFKTYVSQIYKEQFNEDLSPNFNISIHGNEIIIDSDKVSFIITKGMGQTINLQKIGQAPVEDSVVVTEVNNIINKIKESGYVSERDLSPLINNIKAYQKSDKKEQIKKVIISKLKNIYTKLPISDLANEVNNVLDKIEQVNCL